MQITVKFAWADVFLGITDIIQIVENPRFRHCMETSKFSRKKAFQIEVKEATRSTYISVVILLSYIG
jgi:hypothetical protein